MDLSWIEPFNLRRLKRTEYDRLVEGGAFAGEKIQLLEGILVQMSPQDAPHSHSVWILGKMLDRGVADRARVRSQLPLALSEDSEPEPDLAIVPNADYTRVHPSTALLVVEVASSSLALDRKSKAAIYAKAGIPEYWIVNLVERVVEILDQPDATEYRRKRIAKPSESISPAAFPDVVLTVESLLP